jgi:hypothetical protein
MRSRFNSDVLIWRVLHGNCLLKHFIEETLGRQISGGSKEEDVTPAYWKLNEEALDRTS